MNKFLNSIILLIVILIPINIQADTIANNKKPNVILIMTDDQGYGDLHCHGNPIIKTPNLDRLYQESIRLTDFHVSPLCTPTRAGLMAGVDPVRLGAWGTTFGRSNPRASYTMIPAAFKESGYNTAFFGKWHLGDNYPFRPEDKGFDHVLKHGGGGVGQTPDYWGNDYFDDTYILNGKNVKYSGYCTDVWFGEAMKYIEKKSHEPFFCYISTNAPHSPFRVDKRYSDLYKNNPDVVNPQFYGMITNIDENMGRLMKLLKDLGIEDNTILIFLSDNGSAGGTTCKDNSDGVVEKGFSAGMRGRKGSYYEGGHRVPFFIRWPEGGIDGGRDINNLTAHIDVFPTLIDLCGLENIEKKNTFDGTSFASLLLGKATQLPNRSIVVQYHQSSTPPQKWRCTVMNDKWRLVYKDKLYNINNDPEQIHNIADIHPDIVKQLREDYEDYWTGVSKGFSQTCDIVIGSDKENPITLTGFDWYSATPWDQPQVRKGFQLNGPWVVQVHQDGMYEFSLHRWPRELNTPIRAKISTPTAKALDVYYARLKVGHYDKTIKVGENDIYATFSVKLKAGKDVHIKTWFMDEGKNELCGAYYTTIIRKQK